MLNMTIDQILPGTAQRLPGKIALIFGERTLSYSELERLTNQAANGLKALGVDKGDRVTLFAPNSVEWVISYIGIAKAGGVINPVNAMLTAEELAYVVKDCSAKVLITTAERAGAAQYLKNGGDLKEIVVLGGAAIAGTISFDDLLSGQADTIEAPGNLPEGAVDDLLHVRHHRISQRRDARSPQRCAQRGDDRGHERAHRARRPVHRAAAAACLRHGGDEFEFSARADLRDAGKIRCPAGAGIDRASQSQYYRRRADDVSLHAGASRLRQIRLVLAACRRGRRTKPCRRRNRWNGRNAAARPFWNCGA